MDGIIKEIREWLKAFVFAAIFVGVLSIFLTTTMVFSTSMYPTLIEKDILVLHKTSKVDKGEIVSFKTKMAITNEDRSRMNVIQRLMTPKDAKKNLIKRVIAEPGDSISIKDGVVTINGVKQDEQYISSFTTQDVEYDKIPEDKYFLMGDNRLESLDSRYPEVGLIDKKDIIGSALFRIWPVNRIGSPD